MKKIFSPVWMRMCLVLVVAGFLGGCDALSGKTKIKISSWGDLNENSIRILMWSWNGRRLTNMSRNC